MNDQYKSDYIEVFFMASVEFDGRLVYLVIVAEGQKI